MKILFTGGGTFGHVGANLALIDQLPKNWDVAYIGSANSIESQTVPKSIPFYVIASGKLRRYMSFQNFLDVFKVLRGIFQAYFLIGKLKPQLVFSKGGYVALPVVIAAWLRRVPVVAHESDMSPGLTTRLSFPFCKTLCVTFETTKRYFSNSSKVQVTGLPIRAELFNGDRKKGRLFCEIEDSKPVLLVFGGSQGSGQLNGLVRSVLDQILAKWNVVHVCGKNQVELNLVQKGYHQFEYIKEEFTHVLAAADLVICRGGASSLIELIALQKCHISIPLGTEGSRGDQLENARYFESLGASYVINPNKANSQELLKAIDSVRQCSAEYEQKMVQLNLRDGVKNVLRAIEKLDL